MGPAAPKPTTPRKTGATGTKGVRATPVAVAAAPRARAVKTRSR